MDMLRAICEAEFLAAFKDLDQRPTHEAADRFMAARAQLADVLAALEAAETGNTEFGQVVALPPVSNVGTPAAHAEPELHGRRLGAAVNGPSNLDVKTRGTSCESTEAQPSGRGPTP